MIIFRDVFSNSPQITTAISVPTKSRYVQVGTDVYVYVCVCVCTCTTQRKTVCLYIFLFTLWAHILLIWPETLNSLVLLYLGVYLFQMNGRKKKRKKTLRFLSTDFDQQIGKPLCEYWFSFSM